MRNPRVRKIWCHWTVLVWDDSRRIWVTWAKRGEWRAAFDAARFYAQDRMLGA